MAVTAIQSYHGESQVLKKREEECSVFFNFVNGKTLCMLVNVHQEDIHSIKKRLADRLAHSEASFVLASKDMFLVWNGKPLENDCTLGDYNMTTKSHATIFCQQRQRGGCFAVSGMLLCVIMMSILGSTVTCGTSLLLVPLLLPLLMVLPFCCL